MLVRKFLFITLLVYYFLISSSFGADPLETDPKTAKDIKEILDSVKKIQSSIQYQNDVKWIQNTKKEILNKPTTLVPTLDYYNPSTSTANNAVNSRKAIATLLANYNSEFQDTKKNQLNFNKLMIFVSSSIPEESLKSLIIQSKKAEGILVFRGLIDNSFIKTTKFLSKLDKENISAIIDPRLFNLFKVETVPTFIVLTNDYQNCDGDNCNITPLHDRLVGNVTLEYVLEQIKDGNGNSNFVAASYLKKLGKGTL